MKRGIKMFILVIIIGVVILGILKMRDMNKQNVEQVIKKELINKKFDQVKVDTSNADIKIKKGVQYRVVYNGRQKLIPIVQIKKNQLLVEDRRGSININGNLFDLFNQNSLVPLITIEVPEGKLKNLVVDNSNGNVTVQDVDLPKGKIDLANGSVTVNHSTAKGYDLDTANGRITVGGKNHGDSYAQNSESNKLLNIDVANGSIVVN